MNIDAKYMRLLCRTLCISWDESDDRFLASALTARDIDWKVFFKLADREHMTCAFAAALRHRNLYPSLPRPVVEALNRRYLMGTEVNSRIRRQAEEVVKTLNSIGISPLLLKGAVSLCEAEPNLLAGRVLRDLDLMVPPQSLNDCVRALMARGYVPQGEDEAWTYHYRPMYHPEQIVGIELHVRPGEQRDFMSIEEAWNTAVPVALPNLDAVALSPSNRVAHNIFHSEVQDFGHVLASLRLRQLYDLAKICHRFPEAIDWQAVLTRMKRYGIAAAFRARMHLAVKLLRAPTPNIKVDNLGSRIHLNRCFAQLRWPGLTAQLHSLAGVVSPISSRNIDLTYGCGTRGLTTHVYRLYHIGARIMSHRKDLGARLTELSRRL